MNKKGSRVDQKRTRREMQVPLEALVRQYLGDMRLRGLSPETVRTAELTLARLARYAGPNTAIAELDQDRVRAFVADLQAAKVRYEDHPYHEPKDGGLSPFTVDKMVRTIKAFGSWLERENWPNPCLGLQRPKKPKTVVEVLSDEEVDRILGCLNQNIESGARAHAIVTLFLSTGIRLSELAHAELANLDLKTQRLKVDGKGGKERVVPFGNLAARSLTRYLNIFRSQPTGSLNTVFLAADGQPATSKMVNEVLRRLKKKSGVTRLRAHLMRHTFAVNYLISGGDLATLQYILGHESIAVTQIYLHLSAQQVHVKYQAHDPLDRMVLSSQRRFGRQGQPFPRRATAAGIPS
ncbi:MAG: tyrosine-type recombinase/integrase [Anaerolineales bacterium]|nr:tyrosine-type recombinase/integrase [Anaerolineales bacterium]